MSIDANFTERLHGMTGGKSPENTPGERHKAVWAVLRAAEDAEDAAVLLQALGLMDAARELWRGRGRG